MLENAESAAIVNAIAGLGASLNVPITAEGIEDENIIEKLRELGCSKGQGWLFGQPLNIDQVRVLLLQKNLLPHSHRLSPSTATEQDDFDVRKVS
jgi:EAL domain-containing protein (putative c-di-GMP-specific phosphodiesterase class I)